MEAEGGVDEEGGLAGGGGAAGEAGFDGLAPGLLVHEDGEAGVEDDGEGGEVRGEGGEFFFGHFGHFEFEVAVDFLAQALEGGQVVGSVGWGGHAREVGEKFTNY